MWNVSPTWRMNWNSLPGVERTVSILTVSSNLEKLLNIWTDKMIFRTPVHYHTSRTYRRRSFASIDFFLLEIRKGKSSRAAHWMTSEISKTNLPFTLPSFTCASSTLTPGPRLKTFEIGFPSLVENCWFALELQQLSLKNPQRKINFKCNFYYHRILFIHFVQCNSRILQKKPWGNTPNAIWMRVECVCLDRVS